MRESNWERHERNVLSQEQWDHRSCRFKEKQLLHCFSSTYFSSISPQRLFVCSAGGSAWSPTNKPEAINSHLSDWLQLPSRTVVFPSEQSFAGIPLLCGEHVWLMACCSLVGATLSLLPWSGPQGLCCFFTAWRWKSWSCQVCRAAVWFLVKFYTHMG